MNEPNPERIVLTADQRAALGRVYQLILEWRRQRLQREAQAACKNTEQTMLSKGSVASKSEV